MSKSISNRKAGALLTAAVAAVGLTSFGTQKANASLEIDLRVSGVSGGGSVVDNKTVTGVQPGSTITMDVIARLQGQNSTQITSNDIDGDGTPDTYNDDALQILVGTFHSSTGGLLGDLQIPITKPVFKAPGYLPGVQFDNDGDTDIDIGNGNTTDPVTMWNARSAGPTHAIIFSSGGTGTDNGALDPKTKIIDASTSEIDMGNIKFVVGASNLGTTDVNFALRPQSTGTAALWFEDGSAQGEDPYNGGTFLLGAPVAITGVVPEPASLSLLGLLGLGLFTRRRQQA